MKRSEVLKLIEGLFSLAIAEKGESPNSDYAENLLCNLEELGMLPPTTYWEGYEVPRWDDENV